MIGLLAISTACVILLAGCAADRSQEVQITTTTAPSPSTSSSSATTTTSPSVLTSSTTEASGSTVVAATTVEADGLRISSANSYQDCEANLNSEPLVDSGWWVYDFDITPNQPLFISFDEFRRALEVEGFDPELEAPENLQIFCDQHRYYGYFDLPPPAG